jgi:hypothetical protein
MKKKKRKKRNILVKVVVEVAVKVVVRVVVIRVWEEAPKVEVRTQREIQMEEVVVVMVMEVGPKVADLNRTLHLRILSNSQSSINGNNLSMSRLSLTSQLWPWLRIASRSN